MGLAMICSHKRAKIPFFVEQAGVNLYSLEEMAYFFYHNICLVNRTFFDERLCKWLGEEAGFPELADSLRKAMEAGKSFQKLAGLLISASGMYTAREQEELEARLQGLGSMQEQERLKLRADELLQNKNEWAAMEEYRHILRMHRNMRLSRDFYGTVWNNLGVCYARQFLFAEAAECFEISCEYRPDEETAKQAGLAKEMANGQGAEGRHVKTEYADPQKKLLQWEEEYRARQKGW